MYNQIVAELQTYINPEKAAFFPNFFKSGKGQYGEGDQFWGITVPHQRLVVKKFAKDASLNDITLLITNPIHEQRLTGFLMLVAKYQKASKEEKSKLYLYYLQNTKCANNWDLVDSSAHYIVGEYLLEKEDKEILYTLSESSNLWEQRISIMSTFAFIKKNKFDDALIISAMLLDHKHDLIHKAVGWMLREIGKRDKETLTRFLLTRYRLMPRTMLRYAIEKFPEPERQAYLGGAI